MFRTHQYSFILNRKYTTEVHLKRYYEMKKTKKRKFDFQTIPYTFPKLNNFMIHIYTIQGIYDSGRTNNKFRKHTYTSKVNSNIVNSTLLKIYRTQRNAEYDIFEIQKLVSWMISRNDNIEHKFDQCRNYTYSHTYHHTNTSE